MILAGRAGGLLMTAAHPLALLLYPESVVVQHAGWIDVDRRIAAHAPRAHDHALLVEHRNPRSILHDVGEDLAPGLSPLARLCRIRHGVRSSGTLVEFLVAVPGPVPTTLRGAGAAEDRAVEVRRIREVRDPGHAARPDHGGFTLGATGRDDV